MDYKKRYGLKQAPFRLSPDPDFFFPSETHRDALETLLYSIRSGEGFIQITGHPGTGKSMLLRKILKEIGDSVVVGLILHSNVPARDLLQILMQDLKIDISQVALPSRGKLIPLFRDFLIDQARAGNQVIIIVDEAQNLPDETLEELRMLSNLETEKAKLLQIILVGQLELEERINSDRLRQLAQRITIRYRLKPLTREETRSYIFHRLEIAAINKDVIPVSFRPGVMGAIYKYSKGIPRLINIVCERSLMAAYIGGGSRITRQHLDKAILSIEGEPAQGSGRLSFRPATYALFIVFLLMAGLWGYLRANPDQPLVSRVFSSIAASVSSFYPEPSKAAEALVFSAVQAESLPGKSMPQALPVPQVPKQILESKVPEEQSTFSIKQPPPDELALVERWITLPQGVEQLGLINIKEGTFIMVRKKGGKFFRSGEMAVEWPYPQGVYMAGYSRQNEPFIFHPEIADLKKIELDNEKFWSMIKTGNKNCITPIVALNHPSMLSKGMDVGADSVLRVVQEWAETWRSMDLEKIMSYFSNVTSIYEVGKEQPFVFSKARMQVIKKNILRESGFIRLDLSDPICLINPLDPNMAYAVFHQTYQSKAYQDRGTKVLYFRKLHSDSAEPEWKITGKLWILDSDIKTESSMTP